LYLLPIILSALTLGRLVTLLQVGVIALCHLLLASASPQIDVVSLAYASRAVGQLAPFLLVAYLTTTLSADITEARERIENLAQTDALTGLFNLRMFNEVWQREHTSAERGRGMFAVLLPGASAEIAEAVVKRVRHNVFKTTLDLRSRMIRCSVSIGVVNYPKDGRDIRELLSMADRNMYRDKELRRAPGT